MNKKDIIDTIENKLDVSIGVFDLLLGKFIGSGVHRKVYEHATNNKWVVKLQESQCFSNIIEYEIWCTVSYTEYAKWFAPVYWISDNGKVSIQHKVKPITKKNQHLIPDKIPYFFTDLKPDNFGFIGKQLVCHDYDYSLIRFIDNGLTKRTRSSKKLKIKE